MKWTYLLLAILAVTFDQVLKYKLQSSPAAWQNHAGSFSTSLPAWLIFFVSTIVLLLLSQLIFNPNTSPSIALGATLLLAGGLSNLLDRAIYGYVQDILTIFSAHFNLADAYIICGAIIILFKTLL